MLLAAAACGPSAGTAVTDGEQNPHWQRAKRLTDRREFADAAAAYRQALRDNPEFANVHLELGLLYDDKLGDPIAAIYHYRQYLELRPSSPKRRVVEDFIERAKLSVAAKLPQSPIVDPSELGRLQSERAELIRQNSALRAQLAELQHAGARPAPAPAPPPALAAGPGEASSAAAAPAAPRTHVVVKGDTLQSLALRYYGNRSGWERIYQANRQNMPNQDQLKIGQTLVIP